MELDGIPAEFEFALADDDVAAFESVGEEIVVPQNITCSQHDEVEIQESMQQPMQEQEDILVMEQHKLQNLDFDMKIEQPKESTEDLNNQQHYQKEQHQPLHQIQHRLVVSQDPNKATTQQTQIQVTHQPQLILQDRSTSNSLPHNSLKLLSHPLSQSNQKYILAQAAATSGKILLVPINTKPGSSVLPSLQKRPFYLANSNSATPFKQQGMNTSFHKTHNRTQHNNSLQLNAFSPKDSSFNDTYRASTSNNQQTSSADPPKRKPCNCTKSQCLKLYCDCFANGEFCSGCNCVNCFNSVSHEKERQQAILQCLERNPQAFHPKIGKAFKLAGRQPVPESIERRHTKGCNCKRSGCLKNYCECYEAKILCSNMCKCCGCKNYEESFERKSLMQLTSSTDTARGILRNLIPSANYTFGKDISKTYITDKVIEASLSCLMATAQQAEMDGVPSSEIPILIKTEMGRCLKMIVETATSSGSIKH